MAPPTRTISTRIVDRLLQERRITQTQAEDLASAMRRSQATIEEAWIDIMNVPEVDVLKQLAALYRVRFVSTEKLAHAVVDRPILDMVPRKVAEKYTVVPLMYDHPTLTLTVVTGDPENMQALEEVRMVSRTRIVTPILARAASVGALFQKFYNGDPRSFNMLTVRKNEEWSDLIQHSRNMPMNHSMQMLDLDSQRPPPVSQPVPALRIKSVPPVQAPAPAPPVLAPPAAPPVVAAPMPVPAPPPSRPMTQILAANWTETLNVLIALLENERADLRGHSSHVARLTRKLCERLSLGAHETDDIVAAAYLHDIGKHGNYHLTALNVAEYEGHRVAANKSFVTPNRLMAGVNLPDATMKALHHMYERWDGQGFPDSLSGKDIPLGARLLAIADTYADLTQNPRNPFRKTLRPSEANDVLAKYRGTILDNNLVDVFKLTIMGDDIKAKLLANRHTALIVDPDPEETTVLEMRMIEQGFEVKIARTADQAISLLANAEFELIISEIDLQPFDGMTLCQQAKSLEKNKHASWVLVAARADRDVINQGFELGVKDFMQKPVNAEIAVAKLKKIVETGRTEQKAAGGGRGVSGSLTEMGLPEIVQILAQGRKSGALRIRAGADTGEIHFMQGDIWNANWGKFKGADAFYQMVRLTEGDFSLDPEFRSDNRVIHISAEGLLLEGMRLLDEEGAH